MNYGRVVIGLALIAAGVINLQSLRPASGSPAGQVLPSAANNPYALASVRAHPTPGGTITVERDIEPRGGCRTAVASYVSDGLKVYMLVSRPETPAPSGGYPAVILAHGYIRPEDYHTLGTDFQDYTDHYCRAGFAVFKPDYRGHGDSEGRASDNYFSPGYTYDLLNLAASLKTLPDVNPGRIGMVGHSMGGHIVLRALAAPHGLPIKAAVLSAGVVDSLENIFFHWNDRAMPDELPLTRKRITEQFGTPQQNPGFWHDVSAINYLDGLNIPVQIHHGDADNVVPIAFSQRLDQALADKHVPRELYVYPNGDHLFSTLDDQNAFIERSTNFLTTNL